MPRWQPRTCSIRHAAPRPMVRGGTGRAPGANRELPAGRAVGQEPRISARGRHRPSSAPRSPPRLPRFQELWRWPRQLKRQLPSWLAVHLGADPQKQRRSRRPQHSPRPRQCHRRRTRRRVVPRWQHLRQRPSWRILTGRGVAVRREPREEDRRLLSSFASLSPPPPRFPPTALLSPHRPPWIFLRRARRPGPSAA